MRYLFPLLLFMLSVLGCGGGEFELPETREEQLQMLSEKEAELRTLQAEIKQLEAATGEDAKVPDSRLVRAAQIGAIDFEREIELQASVESDETAVVTVERPGRVSAVLVDDGDYVKRGQTVVRIDLESVGVQIADLENNLALARDILQRQERLRAQNIGTEVQYLEAKNTVERLEKSLQQLRIEAGKSAISAPISGTIEQRTINVGEYAAPGMPLMQILDAATVKVVADVPESYLRAVKIGQQVRVQFPALESERTAKITDIGRTIDASNRTFRVEMELDNRDRTLKPNMLATVYLVDYERDDVIVVGSEVVLEEIDGREFVFVAKPATEHGESLYRATKTYVKTGENDALRREILGGLAAGDIIVTEGMRSLTDGEYIRLDMEQPVATAN